MIGGTTETRVESYRALKHAIDVYPYKVGIIKSWKQKGATTAYFKKKKKELDKVLWEFKLLERRLFFKNGDNKETEKLRSALEEYIGGEFPEFT